MQSKLKFSLYKITIDNIPCILIVKNLNKTVYNVRKIT